MRVGDFGLAEDVYTRGYFRQGKDDAVKLPFKWMAPESLRDGLFSEKSDVVSLRCILSCYASRTFSSDFNVNNCSGHLALPAGRYSVLAECLTLVWTL